MLFLIAIVIGIALGLVVGGRITNLARLRFRWPWLLLLAIVVRELVLVSPLNRVDGAQYLYVASLLAVTAWALWHVDRLRGMWLVAGGTAINLLVTVVNEGRMPVASEFAGALARHGNIGQYILMGSQTRLNLLGDWIYMNPYPEAYSPGDVLIALGLAIAVFVSTATPARIVN